MNQNDLNAARRLIDQFEGKAAGRFYSTTDYRSIVAYRESLKTTEQPDLTLGLQPRAFLTYPDWLKESREECIQVGQACRNTLTLGSDSTELIFIPPEFSDTTASPYWVFTSTTYYPPGLHGVGPGLRIWMRVS